MPGVWVLASVKYNEKGYAYPTVLGAWNKKKGAYNYVFNTLMEIDSIRLGDLRGMVESLFSGKTQKNERSYLEYVPNMFLTLAHLEIDESVEEIKTVSPKVPKKPKKAVTKTKVVAVKPKGGKAKGVGTKTLSPKKQSFKLFPVDEYTIRLVTSSEDLIKKARKSSTYSLRKIPKQEDYLIKRAKGSVPVSSKGTPLNQKEIKTWLASL